MKKNNYPIPDILEDSTNVVSSTGFTGLIPSLPENYEVNNYTQIYPVATNFKQ